MPNWFSRQERDLIKSLTPEQVAVAKQIADTPNEVLFSCQRHVNGECPAVAMQELAKTVGLAQFAWPQTDGRSCEAPDIALNMQKVVAFYEGATTLITA